jgi:hypothetical protein
MQPPFQSVRTASSNKEYWARLHNDNDVIFFIIIIINIKIQVNLHLFQLIL